MNIITLTSMIERLASEVETTNRGWIDVPSQVEGPRPNVGVPDAKKPENEKVAFMGGLERALSPKDGTYRVVVDSYAMGGDMDKVSIHMICMRILSGVIAAMPVVPSRLYWRRYPMYEKDADPSSKHHFIHLRLGWLPLE